MKEVKVEHITASSPKSTKKFYSDFFPLNLVELPSPIQMVSRSMHLLYAYYRNRAKSCPICKIATITSELREKAFVHNFNFGPNSVKGDSFVLLLMIVKISTNFILSFSYELRLCEMS